MRAAKALGAAGGVCSRCGIASPAQIVVEQVGGYRVECLTRSRCDDRIRAELRGEAS